MSSDGIGVGGYAFGPRSALMLESLRALPVDFGVQWFLYVDVAGDILANSVASSLLIEGVDSGDRLLGCSTKVDPVNALLIPRLSMSKFLTALRLELSLTSVKARARPHLQASPAQLLAFSKP